MGLAVAPLGFLLLAALLAGCAGDETVRTDPAALEGVPWVHVSGVDVDGWEAAPPSATFDEGRLSGSTGCNRYSGQYTAGDGTLAIRGVALTRMACAPPADEVERVFVAAIETVAGWQVEDEELVLLDGDEEEVLRFAATTPTGSWEATGFVREDVFQTLIPGTEITLSFGDGDGDGEVSGSAGCNTYTATYEVDAATIEISTPAATRRSCPEPAGVMEQEQAYLTALPTAAAFRLDEGTLQLLRADGTGLASFAPVS